jgi:NADH:ubiquinone oxidoreductase subunit C
MTNYVMLIQDIIGATMMIHQRDGWWMTAPDLDVVEMALKMKEWGAGFSTMTGSMLSDNETAVIYHYYLDGNNFNLRVHTHGSELPSISNILPAAEWIEREIQDLFKVQFIGHPHPDRLIRPSQLQAGLFREPGGAAGKVER